VIRPPLPSSIFAASALRGRLGRLATMLALLGSSAVASAAEPMRPIANMFDPLSKPAQMISDASVIVLLICTGIFLVVTGMLVYVTLKFRSRGAADERNEPPQIYGSSRIELAWTVIPIIITVVLILVTTRTIGEIQDHKMPEGDTTHIRLVGHQWWWEIQYLKPGAKKGDWIVDFTTANEIHVPVSSKDQRRPSEIFLESADVIHSFWVPQLNGKTDLVPNWKNRTWIEPFHTGTYFGNCAEYCGTQHANMLLRVIVQEPADFQKWLVAQRAQPPAPATPAAVAGKQVFYANSCVNCHKVDGTIATGVFGPDLTHLMDRQTLGAGVATMNEKDLRSWVADPQNLKPGCLMPNMQLNEQQVDEVVAYLMTLK
jgi:cytochrome c oxidase subunit 2